MECTDATRPSLLLSLRDSENREAWEDFVRIYSQLIFGFCRQRGLQDADAADVAQEVLKAVAGTIRRFEYDPSRGRFRGWLLTVTRNKFNNFLGQKQRLAATGGTSILEIAAEAPLAEVEADWDRELRQILFDWAAQRVRKEVTAKSWNAFWQTAVEGRRGDEVAAALELSVGAVYVAKSRVIARLRELIHSVGDGEPDLNALAGDRK